MNEFIFIASEMEVEKSKGFLTYLNPIEWIIALWESIVHLVVTGFSAFVDFMLIAIPIIALFATLLAMMHIKIGAKIIHLCIALFVIFNIIKVVI